MVTDPARRSGSPGSGIGGPAGLGEWLLLYDPAWQPSAGDERPPLEAALGGWFVRPDGSWEPFEANPLYRPLSPDSPTDPVDAGLRLLARGGADTGQVLDLAGETALTVAVDEHGTAVVAPAPDGVPSVLVTTAEVHRRRLAVPRWADTTLAELAATLPAQGVDVLLNPGAAASLRVTAAAVRTATAGGADRAVRTGPGAPSKGSPWK